MKSSASSNIPKLALRSRVPSGRLRLSLLALVSAAFFLVPVAQAAATDFSLEVETGGSGEGGVGCVVEAGPIEECEEEYEEGTEVTILAEPEFGSEFTEWSGDCDTVVEDECEVEMDGDKTIEVVFDLEEFELTVETDGSGEGVVECQVEGGPYELCPASETYPYETEVIFFAEPAVGSEFLEWEGDCSGVEAECELTVEEPLSVTAVFAPEPPFGLTVETGGTGTGSVKCEVEGAAEECDEEFEEGTEVTVIAEPDLGSEFVDWEGDCDAVVENECEVEMNADKTVKAVFDLEPGPEFTLEINTEGTGTGEVECEVEEGPEEPCEAEYEEGTELALIPVADPGSEFTEWSGDCTGSGACELTMDEEKEVTATFDAEPEPEEEFKLTVAKAGTGSGTVTSSPAGISCGSTCTAEFEEGEEVTLTASAASGSTFSGWSGAGCSGTGSCDVTIAEDTTVTATFTANPEPKPEPKPEPTPEPEGKAKAAATATVKGGKAAVKLTCAGGPCKGTLKLSAKVKQGKKKKNLVIGKVSFSLAKGASKTLKVKLSGPAKKELNKGRALKAKASGPGVKSSTVKLKPQKKKKK